MVNYGYECKDWTAEEKENLANELAKLIKPFEGLKPCPTIEVDQAYPGVRMRKLTWIPEKDLDVITEKADQIHDYLDERRLARL